MTEETMPGPVGSHAGLGVKITARPIEWKAHKNSREWHESRYGFYIALVDDDEEPADERYRAAWGEDDSQGFASLEAAQTWCQQEIDRWVASVAVVTPND
jgi:hypothetical protein